LGQGGSITKRECYRTDSKGAGGEEEGVIFLKWKVETDATNFDFKWPLALRRFLNINLVFVNKL
jgi:hypothetical protein